MGTHGQRPPRTAFVMMRHQTPTSLLERLREPAADEAWQRFVDLYTPLLFFWARRLGLQDADAADLVHDVLTTLVKKLPEFVHDPKQGFRRWLRTVLMNRWRDRCRQGAVTVQLADGQTLSEQPGPDPFRDLEDEEYRQQLTGRALQVMQADYQPTTWRACWEHLVSDRPAAEVARELGISESAVYAAKYRVLRQLRQELAGLLD